MFETGKKKEKIVSTKKKDKKEKEEKKINLTETATEIISEFISLLNIFTLYLDTGAKCILTDTSKANAQLAVIDDVNTLKDLVYKNKETKEVFLKILNGRLSGNVDELYPEEVIDEVFDAMNSSEDKQIVDKIVMSQKKQYYTINEPDKLLEFINGELKPKEKEKKENGEVFTPLPLVNEMMNKLDEAYIKEHGKSIFTEPTLKWFDPAVGIGNFPVIVYLRLMDGLTLVIKDEEERRKHILENMIYASELTSKNVYIYKKIFCGDTYKLNIYNGDTLKLNIVSVWGIQLNHFDVVMGNPPYNKGGIRSHTGKQLGDKNETIWTKFIEKSFEWLKPGGFLVFINPLSWLKKSHSLHNKMLEKHITWLKLWDDSKSKSMINADIPISLYVLQNILNTQNKDTEIISEIKRKKLTTTSFEYLNKNYSIPLAFHSIFDKLIRFIEKHNCSLEYKTKTVKSSGTKIKMPAKCTLEDMWAVDTYILNEGILVKKATEQHPDANKHKLIIANKRGFKGAFIDDGKLSLTGNHKFYILGDNLELIRKIMVDFNISEVISDYLKYGQSFLDSEAFKYIPDLRKIRKDITEDEFYKLIGLTRQEINQIKNPLSNEVVEEGEHEDMEEEQQELEKQEKELEEPLEEQPSTANKLDKELSIATDSTEDAPTPNPNLSIKKKLTTQTPIQKIKRTIKKRKKSLIVTEKKNKIYNRFTKRYIKDTKLNRNKLEKLEKLEKQTLKKGGGKHKHKKKRTIKK